MPRINVLGIDVFYRDEGVGPTVVLGHSSTGSSEQWRSLFARLQDRYRLIAPDHVGYGQTAPYPGGPPLVEHELAIIDSLVHAVGEPVHLVGHSYGGTLMTRIAVRVSERVQTLALIEPGLFYLLAATQKTAAHQEIFDQVHRVIRYVDAGDPEEAARGFIDYWTGAGTYEAMDERVRTPVTAGMAKLRDEWPSAFEASGATLDALAALRMPIQLVAGSQTTAAAKGVIDVLRSQGRIAPKGDIYGKGENDPLRKSSSRLNLRTSPFRSAADPYAGGSAAGWPDDGQVGLISKIV
jgi:pimeloyl-ACP methyl ester carboxylesterase